MQRLNQLFVCVLVIVYAVTVAANDAPIVQTAQGKLKGTTVLSWSGNTIISFIGVRFAEPPVGQNRFKDPISVEAWNGVRNATEDGPLCPQLVPDDITISEGIITSEDCLFLNVHTKSLTGKKPVIIYFHPGGFVAGTGNNVWTGPQYFLDQDIVLVTSNYRLGPFGFISTGDSVMSGNYGLKDQLEVMKWVKQNIAAFGGDPDSVTLFGYSAGAGSIQLHMVSPLSKGLFHRAITSSCSATTPAVLNRDPASLSRRYANLLNCSTETSHQIRDCLLRHSVADLLAAAGRIWDTLQPPFSLFGPVVEKQGGDKRFLRDDPVKLFQSGQFNQVPLITGITRDEFNWRAQFLLTNSTYVNRINNEFDEIAPWEFHYPREPRQVSKRISAALKQFYFNNQPVSNSTEEQLGWLYADSLIIFSVWQAARLIAEKSSAPVYFYKFDFEGRYSYRYRLGTQIPYGVEHHDSLIYLFYIKPFFPLFNQTDPEAYMVNTLTSTYANFAKTGVPTLPDCTQQWTQMTKNHLQHLNIAKPPTMKEGLPYPDRMQVWDSQLPIGGPYHQIFY
uniref:Carboxylic ester hydrolase n=1 Tax=Cuerna arida TaxID=1464854 RepID=A0A1B6F8S3_9HEMI